MKALSLWNPWASLMAVVAKKIETRSWPTSYRGATAIHAAKKWDSDLRELSQEPSFSEELLRGQLWEKPGMPDSLPWWKINWASSLRSDLKKFCFQHKLFGKGHISTY